MQGIAEKNQPADYSNGGGNGGGDSPTQGFSADDEPCWPVLFENVFNHSTVAGLKFRQRVRHAAVRIHVFEIESDRMKPSFLKLRVEVAHEGGVHSLPCAVRQDDGRFQIHQVCGGGAMTSLLPSRFFLIGSPN